VWPCAPGYGSSRTCAPAGSFAEEEEVVVAIAAVVWCSSSSVRWQLNGYKYKRGSGVVAKFFLLTLNSPESSELTCPLKYSLQNIIPGNNIFPKRRIVGSANPSVVAGEGEASRERRMVATRGPGVMGVYGRRWTLREVWGVAAVPNSERRCGGWDQRGQNYNVRVGR
jgi:hypothetical protein